MGWWSGLVLGLVATLVLGGAVLNLTPFSWAGCVDLCLYSINSCFGWGSFRFNSLQMGWLGGCVMGLVLDLFSLVWCWTCCGWVSFRFNNLHMGWPAGLAVGSVLDFLKVGQFHV